MRRHVTTDDPYQDEDFELLDADRLDAAVRQDLALRRVGLPSRLLTLPLLAFRLLGLGSRPYLRAPMVSIHTGS